MREGEIRVRESVERERNELKKKKNEEEERWGCWVFKNKATNDRSFKALKETAQPRETTCRSP